MLVVLIFILCIIAFLFIKCGKIAVHDSFECEGAKVTGQPYGAMVRGMIAGIFAEVFGKPFQVEETECIAKGDKRCVFEIREKRA